MTPTPWLGKQKKSELVELAEGVGLKMYKFLLPSAHLTANSLEDKTRLTDEIAPMD